MDPEKEAVAVLETDDGSGETLVESVADEALKKPLQTEIARKKHWRKKAESTALAFEDYKKTHPDAPAPSPTPVTPSPVTPPASADAPGWSEFHKLSLQTKGYNDQEIGFITTYASGAKKNPLDIVNDPMVVATIDTMRQKARIAGNTPSPSNVPGQCTAPVLDISKMTKAERKEKLSFQGWKGKKQQGQ